MATDAQLAWLTLTRVPRLGMTRLREALAKTGSATALLAEKPAGLRAAGFAPAMLEALPEARARAEQDAQWLDADPRRHLVSWEDAAYPSALREIASPPPVLFVVGDPDVLGTVQLAIVGSRNPTPQGQGNAKNFAGYLARQGLVITSGLALGVDGIAHQAALDAGGLTIAVCGTGLDRVYPARHRDLAHRIAEEGALVSEFSPGMSPRPENFPRRNRIISALSLGTLVVEAAVESGSLITARVAAEQGREVFAIPGSIHNPLARGCHRMIRDGAKLVETAQDVLEELGPLITNRLPLHAAAHNQHTRSAADSMGEADAPHQLDADYLSLIEAIGDAPASVDQLVDRTGLTADVVSSMLLMLELDGHIAPAPGGTFMRVHSAAS